MHVRTGVICTYACIHKWIERERERKTGRERERDERERETGKENRENVTHNILEVLHCIPLYHCITVLIIMKGTKVLTLGAGR